MHFEVAIVEFWTDGRNRETGAWTGNRDINTVMLATALAPGEFLAVWSEMNVEIRLPPPILF